MKSLDPVNSLEAGEDVSSQRAAEFLERRRFGEWSKADQAELNAWLAESILHHAAFLRVEAIAARADRLAALNLLELRQASSGNGPRAAYRWFVLPLLAAASIALAALWGGPFIASLLQPPDRTDSTDLGGRTLLSFADHTQIELNTNTSIRFRITTAERTVWLEKGEAWFHVSHDAAHPFTVFVNGHRVTDLGTEFVARRDAGNVDVALLSGRATLSAAGAQIATLNPGDEAVATPVSLTVTRRTPQQLADALAWRHGMLVFRDAKLSEVVAEFNRYNAVKLVIADRSITDLKFSAELRTDDYEAFLNLAQNMLNLRADREGNSILIYRMAGKKSRTAHVNRGH
jgi:transmembrane sensor